MLGTILPFLLHTYWCMSVRLHRSTRKLGTYKSMNTKDTVVHSWFSFQVIGLLTLHFIDWWIFFITSKQWSNTSLSPFVILGAMVASGHLTVPSTAYPGDVLGPLQTHRIPKYLRDALYTPNIVLCIAQIFPPTGQTVTRVRNGSSKLFNKDVPPC